MYLFIIFSIFLKPTKFKQNENNNCILQNKTMCIKNICEVYNNHISSKITDFYVSKIAFTHDSKKYF